MQNKKNGEKFSAVGGGVAQEDSVIKSENKKHKPSDKMKQLGNTEKKEVWDICFEGKLQQLRCIKVAMLRLLSELMTDSIQHMISLSLSQFNCSTEKEQIVP